MLHILLQNVEVQCVHGRAETPRKAMMDWACGYSGISDAHMHARIHPHTHTHTHTHIKDYAHKIIGVTTLGKSS